MIRQLLFAAALTVACGCLEAQTPPTAAVDGARALEHVRQLVAIGPRVAGSPGAERARDYIKAQMKALGLTVEEQAFEATTPLGRVKVVNLRVLIPGGDGKSSDRLVIGGHYDTKLFHEFT